MKTRGKLFSWLGLAVTASALLPVAPARAEDQDELSKAEAEQVMRLSALDLRRKKLAQQTREKTKAFHSLRQNVGGAQYVWQDSEPSSERRRRLERLLQLSIREDLKESELLDLQVADMRAELELLRARRRELEGGVPGLTPIMAADSSNPSAQVPASPTNVATATPVETFRCLDLPVRALEGRTLDLIQDFGAKRDTETGIAWRSLGWWLAATGPEVRACANGTVAFVGRVTGRGRVVVLEHPGGGVTLYANLNEDPAIALKKGDGVKLGQMLGTPRERFYFEARRGGIAVDPREVLPPALLAQDMPSKLLPVATAVESGPTAPVSSTGAR